MCACCGAPLLEEEHMICTKCRYDMPITGYYNRKDNPVVDIFAGRAMFETASALMFFRKGSHYQAVLHRMKYSGRRDIGRMLGRIYGRYLAESGLYSEVELVVPVPLHFTKFIKRGYNQSREFADGIAEELGAKVEARAIKRAKKTKTQALLRTKEHRANNVEGAFVVRNKEKLENKKVLLVDDIVTTGATLEACADAINRTVPSARLYLGSIAVVQKI